MIDRQMEDELNEMRGNLSRLNSNLAW